MSRLHDSFLTQPIAHRGYHDAQAGVVENSRAAINAAINAGYAIELDVQLSADGHAVVFHDYEMSRLTDQSGALRTRTRAELTQIALKGTDELIPTLPEILTLVAGRVPLLIETKDQDGAMGPDVGPLEQSVADALKGYAGPVAVMSFNPHSVVALSTLAPDVPRGFVTCHFDVEHWQLLNEATRHHLRAIPDYERAGACFVSHRHDDLSNPRIAELKAAGANILCWTIRSVEDEIEARKVAENITFEGYAAVACS